MKKYLKWIFIALIVVFGLLQFANPPRTNPPVVSAFAITNAPTAVATRLRAACYDCHSHETRWPWYAHIAPVSWLVVGDVNEGRKHLNFSEWPSADPVRAAKRLEEMSDQIGYGDMPPKKYTAIHADARLTDAERKELTGWLDAEAARLKALPAK
jgi:hypothetical protein